MFFVSKKVGVKIFCLVSDKQKHAGDMKDFSQLDLSKFEKLTLPWVSCQSYEKKDILEIGSIDKNAFVELTNLTCLHLNIKLKLTYVKLDFKYLINLKELCLVKSRHDIGIDLNMRNYLDWSPPPNLEKLTIFYFDIKLNTLTHLNNLNFLNLHRVKYLGLSDSKAFLDFANLKHLDLGGTKLVFDCIDSSSLHMGPKNLEVLNMGHIGCSNGQQPKIFFENLPNLRQLKVVVKLEKVDIVSLKKLSCLEDLSLDVVECSDDRELIRILGNFSKLKKLSVQGLSRVDRDFIKQFPNLESLTLWGKLSDIQSGSFDSLTNLTALDLSRNKLENIHVDLFKSLTKLVSLNLSWNPLKRISSKLFANLASLNELDLHECDLLDLEPNTFHGLDNLNKLTLSLNKLTHLNEASFKGLKNLTQLNLSSNKLTHLNEASFEGLKNLTQLNLSSNKLTHLNEASFEGLKNLTQLDLSLNELTEINEETFEDTCNLIKLKLDYNQLIDIRFGLNNQSGLQQLKCLGLSGNNLEKFEINLRRMEELNLGHNRTLKTLRPGAFKNLSNLKRLHLLDCSLKVVDANTFEGLFSLEHLNLALNGLEDIEVGTFDFMENLKILNIGKNHSLLK
jgi:Leucine-rich repeat (LRR) protein